MACIISIAFATQLNGNQVGDFEDCKGPRQGHP